MVSVDGMIGVKAKNILKQLSCPLALKWKPYSMLMGIFQTRISIACVRASHWCIQGNRESIRKINHQIQWEDGAGLGLCSIDTD